MSNFILDPTDSYDVDGYMLEELLGMLPYWVKETPEDEGLRESLEAKYGMGALFDMKGGVVKEDGTYCYPEDPNLAPYCKCERRNETYFQYDYGIIAIVYKDGRETFVSRLD